MPGRALAIVGMIIVNFTLALGQNGNPFLVDLSKLFIGKASALFVVLAGVGITLMTKNVERDIRKKLELRKLHWNVVIIWECEINSDVNSVVNEIIESV